MSEKKIIPFEMYRGYDCNGVSGTGLVMLGAVNLFTNHVFTEWCTDKANSMGIYQSFGEFLAIHVFSHPDNRTEIRMGEYQLLGGQNGNI